MPWLLYLVMSSSRIRRDTILFHPSSWLSLHLTIILEISLKTSIARHRYCILNRARGTELVSPEDLLQASELMEGLHLGMQLVRFPSGVMMIKADELKESFLCSRIMEMFGNDKHGTDTQTLISSNAFGCTSIQYTDAASLLKVSLVVVRTCMCMYLGMYVSLYRT